jgi:hypothetical protein
MTLPVTQNICHPLPIESSIFPTLTFKRLPNHQVELLYYRIGKEFKDAIYQATEK